MRNTTDQEVPLKLSLLDFQIAIAYLILVFTVGLYASRNKDRSTKRYFLAGRNLGWFAIGSSLFVTNISSEHMLGLAGSGSVHGLVVGHFEWLATIIILLLGWFFMPIYLKAGIYTLPEFLEKRFNRSSRLYLASVSIVAYILTKIAVTIFAGGILLNALLGWDIYTSAVVMVVITGVYTIIGGLTAVVYTEIIQMFFLIGGSAMLTFYGLQEVGGFTALKQALPADYFNMFRPISDPEFPWTGMIFGAPILGIWYWCTDQYIVQRLLGAKNLQHARSATVFASFLKILPVFIFVLPGMIAYVLFPGIKGDQAFPVLISSPLLPAGLKGLMVAAVLAAVMSSLSSVFNSAATIFTIDFYKLIRPLASEQKLVLVGRLSTMIMVIIAILWIPMTRMISNNVYLYLQSVQAYISPPITAVFVFGVMTDRVNARGAIWTLVIGGMIGFLRLVLEIINHNFGWVLPGSDWFIQLNFLHFAVFLFLVSTAILFLVSRASDLNMAEGGSGNRNFLKIVKNWGSSGLQPGWQKINFAFSILIAVVVLSLWGLFF